jgi:hypothetical protein
LLGINFNNPYNSYFNNTNNVGSYDSKNQSILGRFSYNGEFISATQSQERSTRNFQNNNNNNSNIAGSNFIRHHEQLNDFNLQQILIAFYEEPYILNKYPNYIPTKSLKTNLTNYFNRQ